MKSALRSATAMLAVATAALALTYTASTPAIAQSAQPPVEAFGSIAAMSNPVLSPDGNHVAAIQIVDGRYSAVVYTLDGSGKAPVVIPSTSWIIRQILWAKNDRLLVYLGKNTKM